MRSVIGLIAGISLAVSVSWALQPGGLLDFGSFVMAAKLEALGRDPYAIDKELAAETGYNFGYSDGRGHSPNMNPPISVYLFRPLADLDPFAAKTALGVVSSVLFAAIAWALLKRYEWQRRFMVAFWLVSLAGFWYTLWLGQIYVGLTALSLAAWLLLEKEKRPVLAGALMGLVVCLKPNLALWPLFLLLAGHRKVGLVAIGVAATVSAIPLALKGSSIYGQWLAAAETYARAGLPVNASIVGTAERLGLVEAGYVVAAALVVAAAVFVLWTRPSAKDASAIGIVVALLAGPLTWTGYMLFALPVLVSRRWQRWELAVAGALAFPVWLNVALDRLGLPSAEIAGVGLMILLALTVKDVVEHANQRDEAPVKAPQETLVVRAA